MRSGAQTERGAVPLGEGTPPHGKYVIPEDDPALKNYEGKSWNETVKNYAAMVTLLDQGVASPPTDGISILPALLGQEQKVTHDFLYFEIYEGAFQQCVRMGNWKGYRKGTKDALELYDLSKDPSEKTDVMAKHPKVVKEIDAIMAREHTSSPHYTTPEHVRAKKKKAKE